MKNATTRHLFAAFASSAIFALSLPAWADDATDLLHQADDLVKQAWNPGGDTPAAADRTQMLTKALDLAGKVPDHRLRGTRLQAMRTIQLAIDNIKAGAPDSKVFEELQDADRQLRAAIEISEAH